MLSSYTHIACLVGTTGNTTQNSIWYTDEYFSDKYISIAILQFSNNSWISQS